MNKENKKPKISNSRFTAMSKLIGLIGFLFLFTIVIFSMYEMHRLQDLSNLGQLIISSFAFMSIYAGFYLTMAKMEHLEEERSACKKELEKLRRTGEGREDEIEMCKENIACLREQMNTVMGSDIHTLL